MLSRLFSEATLSLELKTKSPTLVKTGSGDEGTNVTTYRLRPDGHGERQPFIPGSSLKGAFRSHLERVVRGLRPAQDVVCDPFSWNTCGRVLKKAPTGREAYRGSCPACRMFGSTAVASRISLTDAYLAPDQVTRTERRDGVAINRLTGGTDRHLLFSFEPMTAETRLLCQATLRNYEVWQVGALLLLVQHLNAGHIRLGFGKSRGFGLVEAKATCLAISQFGPGAKRADRCLWGLGKFLNVASEYGTAPDDCLESPPSEFEVTPEGLGTRLVYKGEALEVLTTEAIRRLVTVMEAWSPRQLPSPREGDRSAGSSSVRSRA